jgi:hypothetical protein
VLEEIAREFAWALENLPNEKETIAAEEISSDTIAGSILQVAHTT